MDTQEKLMTSVTLKQFYLKTPLHCADKQILAHLGSVSDRAIPGHWEGDLICGSKNSQIVTLVERHSRYVMLAKVNDRKSESVVTALIKQAKNYPIRYTNH